MNTVIVSERKKTSETSGSSLFTPSCPKSWRNSIKSLPDLDCGIHKSPSCHLEPAYFEPPRGGSTLSDAHEGLIVVPVFTLVSSESRRTETLVQGPSTATPSQTGATILTATHIGSSFRGGCSWLHICKCKESYNKSCGGWSTVFTLYLKSTNEIYIQWTLGPVKVSWLEECPHFRGGFVL